MRFCRKVGPFDDRFAKRESITVLPQSWAVCSELMKVDREEFDWATERGLITNHTTLRDARAIHGALTTPKPRLDISGDSHRPVK